MFIFIVWLVYNIKFSRAVVPRLLYLWRSRSRPGFWQSLGWYNADIMCSLKRDEKILILARGVAEVHIALQFIKELRARRPNTHFVLVLTANEFARTEAKAIAIAGLGHQDLVLEFPIWHCKGGFPNDFPFFVWRLLKVVRPVGIILTDIEFWVNLMLLAKVRHIPLALINGWISDRVYSHFKGKYKAISRVTLHSIDLLCMQKSYKNIFLTLGAGVDKIHLMESPKYDAIALGTGEKEKAKVILDMAGISSEYMIILGGSIWPGEEVALLDAYKDLREQFNNIILILAPRRVEYAVNVLRESSKRSLSVLARSQLAENTYEPTKPKDVFLIDTYGELRSFYPWATVVFVGNSLSHHGGHNILEPAAHGKPIIVGPYTEDFSDIVHDFLNEDALFQVRDSTQLKVVIGQLLADPKLRYAYGQRAVAITRKKSGVMKEIVELVEGLIFSDARAREL